MRLHIPTIFLTLLLSMPVHAWQSRFDIDELTLYIPCLEITRGGESLGAGGKPILYEALLAFEGGKFFIEEFAGLAESETCTAYLDLETNELVDQVRHQDNIFDVVLHHDGNLGFSAGSVSFRGRGYTSLWRVSDGVNEVFVGGTVHILNIDNFPLPDYYREAFLMADLLYTEVTLAVENENNEEASMDAAENPDGRLTEILQPATLDRLSTFLQKHNVTIEPIDTLLPYFAGRALLLLGLSEFGYGPGVDYFFSMVASNVGMPNLGLETTANQVNALEVSLEGLTPDELILSALDSVDDEEYRKDLDFVISAWREGNISYFQKANDQLKFDDEVYYNSVLRDRNLAWLPQIEDMFETSEVEFVLVGVGHLAGDDNVLQLLEEAGYFVERFQ